MKIFLIIINVLFLINGHAQISAELPPRSFNAPTNMAGPRNLARNFELPYLDNETETKKAKKIKEETCSTCRKEFYGKPLDFNLDIKRDGQFTEIEDGYLWLIDINSKTAKGIQLYFSEFTLPEGATLHIYNKSKTYVMGAFTTQNMNPSGKFATAIFHDSNATIEYFEPRHVKLKGRLIINKIIHVFKDISERNSNANRDGETPLGYGNGGACTVNVACAAGQPVINQANAVSLLSYYDDRSGYAAFCSGFLINSTDHPTSKKPYLLTAGHCVPYTTFDGYYFDYIFYFNYQSSTCENQATSPLTFNARSFQGAFMKSMADDEYHNNDADYALLELVDKPQHFMSDVVYLGWDRRKNGQTGTVYNISHPWADSKKIAIGANPVATGTMTYASCLNSSLQVWNLSWTTGITQPTSSGSPLLNSSKRVIGLLHGGVSRCSDSPDPTSSCTETQALSGPDFFNRMDWIWNHPGQSSSSTPFTYNPVSSFLDMTLTGAEYINDYTYPAPPPPDPGGGTATCSPRPDEGDDHAIQLSLTDDNVNKLFGYSVAAYGNDIVVGAYGENKVYIYKREGCTINLKQQITGDSPAPVGRFGFAVDIYGDHLIISDPGNGYPVDGFVYIYKRVDNSWTRTQTLSTGSSEFGEAVSIYGDNALVGSTQEAQLRGKAYFYRKGSNGIWTQVASFTGPGDQGQFGHSVDIKHGSAVIGRVGEAHIYDYTLVGSTFTWVFRQKIAKDFYALTPMANNEHEIMTNSGGQLVSFEKEGNNWIKKGQIANFTDGRISFTPSDGFAVIAHDGDKVSYLKKNSNGAWEKVKTVFHYVQTGESFGHSIASTDDFTVVGQPTFGCTYSGSAYVYDIFDAFQIDLNFCTQTTTGLNGVVQGADITLGGSGCSVVYQPSSAIRYEASTQIILKDGFWAKAGSNMSLLIKGCPNFYNGDRMGGGSRIATSHLPEVPLPKGSYLENLPEEVIVHNATDAEFYLSVFPVPTTSNYFIVQSQLGEINKVELYDSNGQLVKNANFKNKTEKLIEGSAPNARGMYFLRVIVDNKLHYRKIYFD